jgi:hypothetical protein
VPLREVEASSPSAAEAPRQEPIKRDEAGNLTGMMASIPTYIGAVLAAGVTAASGGALGGVAVAALVGAAGGGAVGATAGRIFNDSIDASYDEQLRSGGIMLFVTLKHPGEAGAAKRVLEQHAAQRVETHVHTG